MPVDFNISLDNLIYLGSALAIGLLVGTERGWKKREAKEGERIAGIRTFGLIGLLGGCTGLLTTQLGNLAFGLSFIGLAIVLSVSYAVNLKEYPDASITGIIAALLTFVLGNLTTLGYVGLAGSIGVVATILLGMKPVLHRWLESLEQQELNAGLKLLLISVVLLSILPNKAMGPWQAFNPFEIWWMVVLVASISFVGYFAMKIGGAKKGIFLTSLIAGMISSTALTYHFSKLAKQNKPFSPFLSLGILLSCGIMFFRMMLFVLILKHDLLEFLWLPSLTMALLLCSPVFIYILRTRRLPSGEAPSLQNPLELSSALWFGVLLTGIIFLSKLLENYFGHIGLYVLSAISGLVDIDAIVLAMSRMSHLSLKVGAFSILLAAISNTFLKGLLAAGLGGKRLFLLTSLPLVLTSIIGLGLSFL